MRKFNFNYIPFISGIFIGLAISVAYYGITYHIPAISKLGIFYFIYGFCGVMLLVYNHLKRKGIA